MDPNTTLNTIREAIEDWNDGRIDDREALACLVGDIDALDEWLTRGGFLPADWNRKG